MALDANIAWPFNEASEVTLGLDVTADTEVLRALLKQWVWAFLLGPAFLDGLCGGCGDLLGGGGLCCLLGTGLYDKIEVLA